MVMKNNDELYELVSEDESVEFEDVFLFNEDNIVQNFVESSDDEVFNERDSRNCVNCVR